MKLLLVNYEYPPLGGGAGNASAALADAWQQQGHEVYVVTSGYQSQIGWESGKERLHVLRLKVLRYRQDRSNYLEMLHYMFAACWRVPQLVKAKQIDVLVVFFSLPCGPIGWLTRRLCKTPYVISLRGGDVPGTERRTQLLQRLLTPLRRTVLRNAQAIVANSRGLADLSRNYDPFHLEVIGNGVDTDFFSPLSQPKESIILFAGRFQEQKNLFALLTAFAKARKGRTMEWRLCLVGDGPLHHTLEQYASELDINHLVIWMGWLDKTRLREAYRNARIFVNPSLYEGMPNTVLEAMACGLPVIASRVPGNDELIQHEVTGLLFDLHQPEQLTMQLMRLIENEKLGKSLAERARQMVETHYSWNASARKYINLLEGNIKIS